MGRNVSTMRATPRAPVFSAWFDVRGLSRTISGVSRDGPPDLYWQMPLAGSGKKGRPPLHVCGAVHSVDEAVWQSW